MASWPRAFAPRQNELEAAEATLEVPPVEGSPRRGRSGRGARDAVLAQFQRQQELLAQIEADLDRRPSSSSRKKQDDFKDWLKAQQATGYGGGHSPVPMPAGWEDVLERCPVDGPRSFGDGFGAPRYVGGYHLHKGVDILAPSGTPIVAPFAARPTRGRATRWGATPCSSQGRYGRVYNAHLSAYSSNSDGPVQAGDVIGYVGDTGQRDGHPARPFRVPSERDAVQLALSSYGYSIIEDAINPYPLLVAACG